MSALPDEGKSAAASRLVGSQLTTLYEQYYTDVYAYCRRRLRNREEAEDATQVTFVKAFAAFRRGIVPDTEAAWLFTIAKRVVLTRLGVTNRLRAVETVTELDHFEAPDAADLAEFHELQRAIEALPETSRRAFVMREWQGLQYEEIADELGLQRSHVGVILLRARRQVVKQLRTALSFGPAPAFLRRGLEMLSTEGAHIAAASAIAASAPVLVVVAPMSGSASAATTTHASMTSVAAASSGHTSPLGSRFAQHGVAAGGSRRAIAAPAATSIIARISLPAAPTPSVAATAPVDPVDPADSVGIVDPVVPTPVEPQPQEPARTIASDPGPADAAPEEPFDAEPTIGGPTEDTSDGPADVPAEPASHSDESDGGSAAAPASGVEPGQGDETADSTPGHTGIHPPQSAVTTTPGQDDSSAANGTNNGNGPNSPATPGAGHGNAFGIGNRNCPATTTPPAADLPTDPAAANGNNGNGSGNGRSNAATPPATTAPADPAPPVTAPPATTGNGIANGNGQAGAPVAPPVTPTPPPWSTAGKGKNK